MTALQAIITAILQGITELFPVSSLGHAVILPRLLGWNIDQHAPDFLPFLVVLHLGTAVALLIYFWRDWLNFGLALIGQGPRAPQERRIFWLVCLATLPAVVIGYTFRKLLGDAFATPAVAAVFLIVNGFVLFLGEKLRTSVVHEAGKLDTLGWQGALGIGLAQCTALIPGISRSGATMVGGVLAGLNHADSARFSFLLATPIILGAAVLEAPKLLRSGATLGGVAVLAGVVAGTVAYISIWALMRYFRGHDFEALNPFAWYCWAAGAGSLTLIWLSTI